MTLISCGIGYWSILRLPDDWLQDDQRIVIDEVIGMFITMLWLPLNWYTILIGFVLFRGFDIFKPFGIRSFDRKKTNWAVIVDDMIAGVYANIVLRTIIIFLF
jgi:phosphatidylglycerophosphatase A